METIEVNEGQMQFLEQFWKHELDKLIEPDSGIEIKPCSNKNRHMFQIKGDNKKELASLKKKISRVVDGVKKDKKAIRRPCAGVYFNSEKGRQEIKSIELTKKCVIHMKSPLTHTAKSDYLKKKKTKKQDIRKGKRNGNKSGKGNEYVVNGIKFKVVKGDMTQMTVDVMVNTANQNMDHKFGLAKAIVKNGGQGIQDECHQYVKDNGKVGEGEVVESGPGNLPCNLVLHAVTPTWSDGKQNEIQILKSLVKKCIACVSKGNSLHSIAIPALGCGMFKYPLKNSAKAIVECLVKLANTSAPDMTSMKEIMFCDVNQDAVDEFKGALDDVCGDDTTDDSSSSSDESSEDGSSSSSESDSDDEPAASKRRRKHGSCASRSEHGNVIKVVTEKLANMKADVIVNSVKSDLDFSSGALSRSLLQAGGQSIQDECQTKRPSGIKHGEVVVTKGGNLSCDYIYHSSLPAWDGEGGNAGKILKEFVTTCLEMANKYKKSSIAIPAMGTKGLGYPVDAVARMLCNCSKDFLQQTSSPHLSKIMLVVYPGDKAAAKAFRAEQSKMNGTTKPVRASTQCNQKCNIKVSVVHGDITKETTDVIVNSTNESLDLSKGATSRAILKAAGDQLKDECSDKAKYMKSKGLVHTSAGSLSCKGIFHIKSQKTQDGWEEVVSKCLQEAEHQKYKTISFPALGTGGQGCSPQHVSAALQSAIQDFSLSGPHHVQEVRIVVFEKDMVDTFSSPQKKKSDTKQTYDNPDEVVLILWSNDHKSIGEAKKMLDELCDDRFKSENISDDNIKKLKDKQHRHLEESIGSNLVHVSIDNKKGEIILEGHAIDVLDAKYKAKEYLNNLEKKKDEFEKAQAIADFVQWKYEMKGKKMKFYLDVNYQIEMAYKAKKPTVEIKDRHGEKYCVDFKMMEEWAVKDPGTKFKVIRVDAVDKPVTAVPNNWVSMSKNELVKCVPLTSGSNEYERVKSEFLKSAGGNYSIIQIERVQNMYLYQQYAAKRAELQQKNQQKFPQRWLWHGTDETTVKKINHSGFNRSYCGKHGTAYGSGVYFAVNASYSVTGYCAPDGNGNRHIYSAQVLTGDACQGQSGMRVLPQKAPNSVITYDSSTDSPSHPQMFVIFHDSQAYPTYHITFK